MAGVPGGHQLLAPAPVLMVEDEDAELVRRCRRGDQSAFAVLLRRYERPVYNAALRMLRDAEEARDVAQTVFMKVYEHLADYDPKYRFYSWVYRIAVNESLHGLDRRHRVEPIDDDAEDDHPGPYELLREQQATRSVQSALMRIKPEYRAVIVLKHILGCSYHDMSEILKLPEKTVKSRLFTARQLLKEALLEQGTRSA